MFRDASFLKETVMVLTVLLCSPVVWMHNLGVLDYS